MSVTMQRLRRIFTLGSPKGWVWLVIAVGALLRVAQYVAGRSLWLDEAKLALNIVNRSYVHLLRPLEYDQGAPLGFLFLEKLAVQLFGPGELALRLLPLLSGLLALALAYPAARQFVGPRAALIALAMFAVLDNPIYYSSEVKQYSSDMAVTMVILLFAKLVEQKGFSDRLLIYFALVGSLLVWVSHPAIFVLVGVGLALGVEKVLTRSWDQCRRLGIGSGVILLSFAGSYLISLSGLVGNQSLVTDWNAAFFPFPPRSLADWRWPIDVFFRVFDDPVGLALPGLGAAALIIGVGSLWFGDRAKVLVLSFPVLVALLASALHVYPFSGRLLLFLVPIVLILMAEGVCQIRGNSPEMAWLSPVIIAGLLLFHPTLSAAKHLAVPRTAEEISPVLEYMSKHRQNGDIVYVYYSAQYALAYYSERYRVGDVVIGMQSRDQPSAYLNELDRLRGNQRVWILFSHVYNWRGTDEADLFLGHLDSIGTRMDVFERPGAKVYLYNLGVTVTE